MKNSEHLSALKEIISRHRLLEQVDNGVRQKRELNENLDTSRTTIDRAIRELENENILHRRNGTGCEFTRFGKLAYEEFCRTSRTFQSLDQASEPLSILPGDSPLDVTLLNEATIKLANQRAPVTPFQHFRPDSTAERIQTMLPVLFPQQLQFLCEQAEAGADIQLLLHEDLIPIIEDNYSDQFDELTRDSVQLRVSLDLPQFGLTIIDSETVWVSVHRESGGLYGLIENSHTNAVTRAASLFSRFISDSHQHQAARE